MKPKTILIVAGVLVGAYLLYTYTKKPTSTGKTVAIFDNLGADKAYLSTSGLKDNTGAPPAFVQYKTGLSNNSVTTYKFNTGDYDKLNFAQKFLLNIRIPAEYVLG